MLGVAVILGVVAVVQDWSLEARASIIAGLCLLLWLGELVPVWVPTIILWVLTPLLLASQGAAFGPIRVLAWSADPVLALFFGGFALAAAAARQGADSAVASHAIRMSGGVELRLLVLVAAATAVLSMWISGIAAAALMFGALQPISFIQWMALGVPLTVGLLAVAMVLIAWRFAPHASVELPPCPPIPAATGRLRTLGAVFFTVAALWLTEPLHGVRAWIVAVLGAFLVLALRLIGWRDLMRIDWSTLVLIAGGIALGALLENSGLVEAAATGLPFDALSPMLRLLVLCLVSAGLSALMSNTATATFLIPIALSIDPSPSTAVLVAIACSLGMPFVISTPPNAMAVGNGLRSGDLLVPGLLLMIGGSVMIALTGPWVLRVMGVE